MSAGDLNGRRALVTGGASGIGEQIVAQLVARGAKVMAVDLAETLLTEVSERVGCSMLVSDITTEEANWAMVHNAVADLGGIDMVFLNAGILGRSRDEQRQNYRAGELDLNQYRKVMAVNTDAVIYGTVAAAASMSDGGAIVATASAAGLIPWTPTPFYTATKHAVVGWVRAMAPSLSRQNVTINAVCPGGVATALLGLTAEAAADVPQLLTPAQVATAEIDVALGDATGGAVTVVANRDPIVQVHEFSSVPDFP